MTLDGLLRAVARILANPAARQQTQVEHGKDEISEEEAQALSGIDPRFLGMVAEGFAGKRMERLASWFPRTLSLLPRVAPGWMEKHLGTTPTGANPEQEAAAFAVAVRAMRGRAHSTSRLLRDMVLVEDTAGRLPAPIGLPRFRDAPTRVRPARSVRSGRVACEGPVEQALAGPPGRVEDYPSLPGGVLVVRTVAGLSVHRLTPREATLWDACDGAATVDDLARQHGPWAMGLLRNWLRQGFVEDTAKIEGVGAQS